MSSAIPACRLGARRVVLRDAQGVPMAGRRVHAELMRHRFLFGCGAFDTVPLLEEGTSAAQRALCQTIWDSWRELFNFGTLPFYWAQYEQEIGFTREKPVHRAAEFLIANRKTVKGHPLCWHTRAAPWLMPMSDQRVEKLLRGRITREVTAFRDVIHMWDVVNELVIMPEFDHEKNAITRLCRSKGRVALAKLAFDTARAADPEAVLLLNDFNTSPRYRQLIEDCLASGVPIDAIGVQSHQHQGPWGMEKLARVVERFAVFGLPIHFTENTFISGALIPPEIVDLNDYRVEAWLTTPKGEENQARWLLEMIDFLFAQPQVEAFTTWCLIDDRWLHAPAGLLRADGSRKPAFEALYQRIRRDWHTAYDAVTDEAGGFTLAGVQGDYAILADGLRAEAAIAGSDADLLLTMKEKCV